MKKALIIVGLIGILYIFVAFILPTFITVPLATYQAKKVWTEHEKESSELVLDSIGNFPFPIGSVSDYEKVFNNNQISNLTKIILEYKEKTTFKVVFFIEASSGFEPL